MCSLENDEECPQYQQFNIESDEEIVQVGNRDNDLGDNLSVGSISDCCDLVDGDFVGPIRSELLVRLLFVVFFLSSVQYWTTFLT